MRLSKLLEVKNKPRKTPLMLKLSDIEKEEKKKQHIEQNQNAGIEQTDHVPMWKNKKLMITAVVFVAVMVGGYIVYKKVLVKRPPVATTTAAF